MNKKIIILFLLILIMTTTIGCSQEKKAIVTGIYLKSLPDTHLIIIENSGPVVMGNKSGNDHIFDNLKSGDQIEVSLDAILETYPGQTNIYSCKLIQNGTTADIPLETLKSLQDMGWKFDLN